MNIAERIVEKFGGDAAMSRKIEKATGRPVHPTSIQYWRKCGYIPVKRQPDVLKTAKAEDIPMGPADFFEPEPADSDPTKLAEAS